MHPLPPQLSLEVVTKPGEVLLSTLFVPVDRQPILEYYILRHGIPEQTLLIRVIPIESLLLQV